MFKTGNGIIPCTSRPSDQITSCTKCFLFYFRSSAFFFKTGNRIIKTGNGFIIIELQEAPGRLHLFSWITIPGNSRKLLQSFIANYAGYFLFSEIMIFLDKPIRYFVNVVNNGQRTNGRDWHFASKSVTK